MAILEKEVAVKLSGGINIKYYESLGYSIPRGKYGVKRGTEILVDIKHFPLQSNVKVTKVCDICGDVIKNLAYQVITESRLNGDGLDRCSKCGKDKAAESRRNNVKYEKSLEYYAKRNHKEYLLIEFSKNNQKKPKDISYGSNHNFLWNCNDCKSEYDMQMAKRVLRDFKCPYCKGRRVNHTNSLENIYPEILKKWNYKLNSLSPREVYCLSTKKYWWKCDSCYSDYHKSIYQVIKGIGCPYCTGQKTNHTNSLASLNPTLASEWHPTKNGNLTPHDVTCGSTKRVWWNCKECNYEWETTLAHRGNPKNSTGCPMCSSSHGEKAIRDYLISHDISFVFQKSFEDLKGNSSKPLSYDFYIEDINLLIEFNGVQHYEYSSHYHGSIERFKTQQENDIKKINYAENNGFNLLTIKYHQIKNITDILEKEIRNHE